MAQVQTGVIVSGSASLDGPMNGIQGQTKWIDLESPATWAVIWTVLAFLFLCHVLRVGRS